MKDFSKLPLKYAYDSGIDDVLTEFYIPVLSEANRYDRIAGFFSSSVLALAAKGLEQFIINGGTMRLVTCPKLSSSDVEALRGSTDGIDELIYKEFVRSYDEIEDKFEKNHVKALGWMIANNLLEIKIAVVKNGNGLCDSDEVNRLGIMHQKVGILYDQTGNVLSFSGSNNESAGGWMNNTEEFKVFCSWKNASDYIMSDVRRFESFWSGQRRDVEVRDIPSALKEKLIVESKDFDINTISTINYNSGARKKYKQKLKLFHYQDAAVKMWDDNDRALLLQMATGTGKTRTAIGCISKALKDTKKLLVVIACPQVTLAEQWRRDIDSLDVGVSNCVILNGNVRHWEFILRKELLKLNVGQYEHLVVFTTHNICSSEKYLYCINERIFENINKFLVGDEVHGMGAPENKKGLLKVYKYRLGLSATPQRWFDDAGSRIIEEYFGSKSFVFSIHDALTQINPITNKNFLVQFNYNPCFISLTDDEIEEYRTKTLKIIRASRYCNDDDTYLQKLRFERANIEKNALEKYDELVRILDKIEESGQAVSDTIIFVSDAQIDNVITLLGRRGIAATKFTKDQGTEPKPKYGGLSERDYIIDKFKSGDYQVLVAIKCLDEGIDIPSADTAIIMASSTNPREYVQRIGRIIRQAPGKRIAHLYDMIIKPDFYRLGDDSLAEVEKHIFEKEMVRVMELSDNALNRASVMRDIYRIMEEVL